MVPIPTNHVFFRKVLNPVVFLCYLTPFLQNSLEQWASWLEGVVDQVLKQHEGTEEFPKAARQFLLKWSFYRYCEILFNEQMTSKCGKNRDVCYEQCEEAWLMFLRWVDILRVLSEQRHIDKWNLLFCYIHCFFVLLFMTHNIIYASRCVLQSQTHLD